MTGFKVYCDIFGNVRQCSNNITGVKAKHNFKKEKSDDLKLFVKLNGSVKRSCYVNITLWHCNDFQLNT